MIARTLSSDTKWLIVVKMAHLLEFKENYVVKAVDNLRTAFNTNHFLHTD